MEITIGKTGCVTSSPFASWDQHARVVINPEDETVSILHVIGNAVPFYIWHDRAKMVSVDPRATCESVQAILEANSEVIEEVIENYVGSEWDGHNHIGQWRDSERVSVLLDQLRAALSECETYCEAASYFGEAWSESKWELSKAPDCEELADKWIKEALLGCSIHLDRSDVLKVIERMQAELDSEPFEEGEEPPCDDLT